jgi:hypothetical protein
MKTVTIGFMREDGDIQVLATMNNNDGIISPTHFKLIVEGIRFSWERLSLENVQVFERQDAPDYVTPEETMKPTDEDQTLKAALLMESMGGSFAASIAKAWIVGDSTNKRRVYAAFDDLFAKYETWAQEDSK